MSRFRYEADRQAAVRAEVARLSRLSSSDRARRFRELRRTDRELARLVADRHEAWLPSGEWWDA